MLAIERNYKKAMYCKNSIKHEHLFKSILICCTCGHDLVILMDISDGIYKKNFPD